MTLFNPSRLKIAREKSGLTQSLLAQACSLETRSVIAHEGEKHTPKEENISTYSDVLKVPKDFFYGEDLDQIDEKNISFRNVYKLSKKSVKQLVCTAQIAICMVDRWILEEFDLPHPILPEFTNPMLEDQNGINPEMVAKELRTLWGLGLVQPINNMMDLVEMNGIRVFSIPDSIQASDTFSLWHDEKPYIFLKSYRSAEQSRFALAHELGHLIMHKHGQPLGQQSEKEANFFASALLMPEENVKAKMFKVANIYMIAEMKKDWKVSWRDLNSRAHQLGLISDWNFKQIISDGIKNYKEEPFPAEKEESQIFGKIFSTLRDDGISSNDVARQLGLHLDDLDLLTFGQAKLFEKTAQQKRKLIRIA